MAWLFTLRFLSTASLWLLLSGFDSSLGWILGVLLTAFYCLKRLELIPRRSDCLLPGYTPRCFGARLVFLVISSIPSLELEDSALLR